MFLRFLPTKNAKMDAKHSLLGKKRTLRETCIMNVLLFSGKRICGSQEPQGKKRKKLVNIKKFLRYQYAEIHE